MKSGKLTSRRLVEMYLERIKQIDTKTHSVLELNPDALAIADAMDKERKKGKVRGPMHGIPVLIKDNIDTADKMHTTAGSLALLDAPTPKQDSAVAANLRKAGAVIMGKTNLSEWANFRANPRNGRQTSGWSGRGGQTNMPYFLDQNPSGSSSGSGVSVSANLCAVAIGTETNGSIISPACHQRRRRPQADRRPRPTQRHRPDLAHAGHGRPDGPHRHGCRDPARSYCRQR